MRAFTVAATLCLLVACGGGPAGPSPNSTEPPPPPAAAEGPLSGRWVGLSSEGRGLITTSVTREDYCINYYDYEGTLTHQGTKLTGTMTSRFAGADCLSGGRAYHVPADFAGDKPVTDFLELVVNPTGGVFVTWADWVSTIGGAANEVNQDLSGTYTTNTINLAGERVQGQSRWSLTFGLRRQ